MSSATSARRPPGGQGAGFEGPEICRLDGNPLLSLFQRHPTNLLQHFEPMHEFNEVEMFKRVVEMDAGIAILPEALVREEVANRRLAAVPFLDGGHTEPLAVIYRHSRALSPSMENFIKVLNQPMAG